MWKGHIAARDDKSIQEQLGATERHQTRPSSSFGPGSSLGAWSTWWDEALCLGKDSTEDSEDFKHLVQAQQALRSDSSRVTHCEKCTGKGHASVNSGNFCKFLGVGVSTLPGYHQRHVVQCSPWNSDSGVSSPGRTGFFEKLKHVETTHSFKVPLCCAWGCVRFGLLRSEHKGSPDAVFQNLCPRIFIQLPLEES